MTAALASLSDPGGRQLLVTGRIADAVSGRGIDDAALSLAYDAAGSGAFRPLRAVLARRADGWFAFHLAPRHLPPPIGAFPALRLAVEAARHTGAVRTIAAPPADLAIAEETRMVLGHPVSFARIAGAPFRQSVALDPRPVALEVTVLVAGDPADPAIGATVEMLTLPGGSALTDASGSASFAALPVVAAATFRVTRGGTVSQHVVRPDFALPVNRVVFAVPA